MEANKITPDELRLLAYLHERAPGYGAEFTFDGGRVATDLGVNPDDMLRHVSYLREFGLAGANLLSRPSMRGDGSVGSVRLQGIWLTGLGENYMRDLEARPGIATRLTVDAVGRLTNAAWEIVTKVGAEFAVAYLKARGTM